MGRLDLQSKLLELAPKAWYQKPPSNRMTYPCFVYKAIEPDVIYADNRIYRTLPRYEILYISQEENDAIWDIMANAFDAVSIGRKYVSDNLYHYPFTISFK